VIGFDSPDVLSRALARGAIHEASEDFLEAVYNSDFVYISLPIATIMETLPAIAKAAKPGALITDAGSTKVLICHEASKHFQQETRFLGGHPIAGKETSGIDQADENLFNGAQYALVGSKEDFDPRVHAFTKMLGLFGATPVWCDPETHDWAVGMVSHLPQLVAIALAGVIADKTDETGLPLNLAGQGARDMLRLAASSFSIWRDIAHTNTQNISHALDQLAQAVEHLRINLTSTELKEEFLKANEVHRSLQKFNRRTIR
jgi:prephenate dehydrogenase